MKKIIKNLNHADVAIGLLTLLMVAGVAGLALGPLGVVLGAFAGSLAAGGSQRQRAALQARINAPAQLQWEVMVNNVRVGTITDAEYATLEQAALTDWRVHWAQGRSVVKALVRTGEMLILMVPVALFWLGLAIVFADPEAAIGVVEALRAAPGSEIVTVIDRYARSVMLVFFFALAILALFASPRLGFRNMYREEVGERVRRRVRTAAVGRMVLVPHPSVVPAAVT